MSEFNNNNISNYSWVPDRNADHKIELGTYQTPAQTYPNNNANAGAKKKSHAGLIVVAVVLCILLSGAAAFGSAFLATRLFTFTFDTEAPDTVGEDVTDAPSEAAQTTPDTSSVTINRVEKSDKTRDPKEISLVASVAAKVKDSVVEITTSKVVSGSIYSQYIASGAGSGVIIAKEGYIITNNHVIEGADTITVRTTDGTEYAATIIGADSTTDIAVLKIDAGEKVLTTALLGDSLIVGEPVVAIGNPLGQLGGSVTDGIISALDRVIVIDGEKMTLLQHNAAVNPGNSGGGLFNSDGDLIGIVNAKSSGEDVEGIGFAIPINNAFDVVKQLIEYGYVRGRAYLGLELIDIQTAFDAMYYRVNAYGVYVVASEFTEDIKQGDRITALDGEEVNSYSSLKSLLAKKNVGDEVTVTVVRGGKIVDVRVVCREYEPSDKAVDFG